MSEQRPEAPVQAPAASPPGDRLAARLRRFGPLGILAMLVILLVGNYPVAPAGAILALVWVHWSRTPWREIGYVRPDSWTRDLAIGIAFGIAFKVVMKAIAMPLFGAPPINQAYHYMTGNPAALPGAAYLMIAGGGFGEETVFRGFLFERFGKLLGSDVRAKTLTVLLTSALFALAHYPDQGLPGVEQASITGLVLGTIFAVTGRLDPDVCARCVRPHGARDDLLESRIRRGSPHFHMMPIPLINHTRLPDATFRDLGVVVGEHATLGRRSGTRLRGVCVRGPRPGREAHVGPRCGRLAQTIILKHVWVVSGALRALRPRPGPPQLTPGPARPSPRGWSA